MISTEVKVWLLVLNFPDFMKSKFLISDKETY